MISPRQMLPFLLTVLVAVVAASAVESVDPLAQRRPVRESPPVEVMFGIASWTAPDLPTPRTQVAAGAIDGKLYVAGGGTYYIVDGTQRTRHHYVLEIYDPATESWSAGADMLTARSGACAAVVEGKLYVIGGTSGPLLDLVEVYDPATNTWTSVAPMPTARAAAAAVVLDGKIYVIGGDDGVNGPLPRPHDNARSAVGEARRAVGKPDVRSGKPDVRSGKPGRRPCRRRLRRILGMACQLST